MLAPGKKGVSASTLLARLAGAALAEAIKSPSITINGGSFVLRSAVYLLSVLKDLRLGRRSLGSRMDLLRMIT